MFPFAFFATFGHVESSSHVKFPNFIHGETFKAKINQKV